MVIEKQICAITEQNLNFRHEKLGTLTTDGSSPIHNNRVMEITTYSPYVNQKYKEFQEEHGYIPEFFNPYNKTELSDIAPTLTAQGESITKSGTILKCDAMYRIRKLTPKECWRLMDFTDEDFDKAEAVNSNTQLYKQAGNSIVVNVLEAILGQMIPGKEDFYKTRCS